MLLIRHKKDNREKEILGVASITQHGLASNEYNLPYYENYSDNSNTIALVEYFEIHSESKQSSRYITTNSISDIFQSVENGDGSITIPKFILIEGAPGMGKTTLCKEIAYKWANKCLLNDVKLVLLIYLRDPAIMKIYNLTELIHYFYNDSEEAKSKQYAQMLTKDSNHVVVILDGYDEIGSSKQPLINKILNRHILPKCRIIVTSRLTASDILHSKADVRVEVLGFTDESKVEYIKQELRGHPDEIQKLQTYLDSHPSIKSICYMPIMMTIIVYIFKMKSELPTDSIELYDKFIALTISCHLQKQYSSTNLFTSLKSLPADCEMFLSNLSKFAFLTLKSDQKVFDNKDIESLCPALANTSLEHLGLINSVQYFCIDKGSNHVFNFLHLSIHEYLAAYYINSIDRCSQFDELEATFLTESYKETWKQVIGLNRDYCLTFQNYSIYCKNVHHKIISSWITDCKYLSLFDSFIELCNVMMTTSTIRSERIQLLLQNNMTLFQLQIYFSIGCVEYGQSELYMFEGDLVIDWQELGYKFVKPRNLAFVCIQNVNLLGFKANEQQLMKCFRSHISFSRILLEDCCITSITINAMKSHFKTGQHFQHFELINCTFEPNGFTKLADILNGITTLRHIKITNSILTNEDADALPSVILCNPSLQTVDLRKNHLDEDHIAKVMKSIQQNIALTDITINTDVTLSGIDVRLNTSKVIINLSYKILKLFILQPLYNLSSLKVFVVCNAHITKDACKELASVIMCNTKLEELYLHDNNLGVGTIEVAKALQHITTLRILELGNNNIPEKACDELALAIQSNEQLEKLWLSNNNLNSSAIVILNSLATITTLTVLNLNNNQIPKEADEALASVIMHNTRLEELYLNSNNLGIGTVKVSKSLQHITTLKILSLSSNNIPQKASEELALVIKSNEQLEKLWLNDNNLHSSAIVILNSLATITTLTVLVLNNNQIPHEACEALASVIMHNTRLEELYLRSNNLGIGTVKVAKSLQHITTVKILSLSSNNIPQEASEELALAIESNQLLKKLWISNNNLNSSAIVFLNSLATITTLTVLDLSNNQIPHEAGEALASVIMHNTRLEELYLHSNNLGIEIVKIAKSLQHITTVKILSLSSNNIPQEASEELALAIESNQLLKKLWVSNNNLHSSAIVFLNSLATITTLTVLNLNNNQISQESGEALAFVIMHNTRLEELYLDSNNLGIGTLKVARSLQHITTVKVLSFNNNIPQEASEELALAIKSNKQLEKLSLIDNNLHSSAIVILNSLATITTLTVLVLNNNQIPHEAGDALASVIMHNTRLEELYLRSNNLGIGTVKVAKSLQHITTVKILSLSSNNIPQEASEELALAIESNQLLKKLWISNNNLHSSAIVFLNSLATITTLTVLDLSNNQIPHEAGEALASVIMHNTRLEELYLHSNNLGIGTVKIAKSLQHITTLKMLSLGSNSIPQEASEELALAIESNQLLKKLWVSNNNLHSSAIVFLNSLATNTTMTVLNLNNNQISQESGEALAFVIMHNTRLEELYLDSNNLGIGTLKVARSLQHIITVKVLSLDNNNIPQEASEELALAIKSNKQLEKLSLIDNNLHSSAIVILNSLATITTLTVLVLNNNQIPHEAGEALASVIMHNTRLEELYLHSNNLGIGTVKVAKSLQHITTVKVLYLDNNNIPQEASEELALAIKSNKQLKKLSLNDNNLHSSAIVILNSLATITTLTVLVLNNNQIPHEAGEALASVIMHNTRLEELYLHSNNLGIGTVKIAKSLQHITTLKMLSLGSNSIPQEASEELALAIESNQLLKKLWISNNSLHFSAIFILNSLATITTLTVLNLSNNQIPHEAGEALASVIMHNTRLEELYLCSNNLGIGTVKVAKSLQHITTIKVLYLDNNNIPQEASEELALAIKSNKQLEKLSLNDNNLHSSAIFILNCLATITTLTVLVLNNNQIPHEAGEALASVIMHNTRLEELYLDSNNLGIGTLKVARSLQHITTVKVLSLDNNNIPQEASEELALAIKSNKQLEKLSLIDNNLHSSAIVILNSLATITTLTVLVLNNNQIPHEAGEALASVIMHNTRLEELYLHSNNLGIGTVKVAKSLQHITTVKVLYLDNNNIPQEASEELALAIKSNKQLKKLSLNDNNLHSSAIVILNSLATITTLTVLVLNNNQIPHEAGEALASVIMHNTKLEELYLHSNNLGIGTVKVAKSLQHITTIKVLYLDNNNIPQEASEELALAIKSNKQLEKLSLNDNNLHSSAIFILNCLATITTLTVLVLNNNQIPHEAGEALASVIMHNTRLEELYLHSNNLGIGTVKIAKSLQHITTLKMLSLGSNSIPQEASEELALAIESNQLLKKLWVSNNNLHSSAIVFLNSLATNTTLTVLNLNNNQISQESGEALAFVIMHNTRLEELYLDSNNLGIGTLKVARSLQHITTVKVLSLDNNNIPQEASEELALAIKSNKQLEKLSLNDNNLHSSAIVFLNSLATITTLTVLVLNNNQIPHEAGEALASVIMHNTRLEELYLDSNNLGIGTLKVARSLQHITAVKVLSLENNNIPQEASEELALAIKSNKQLKKLSLNDNNLHSSAIVILNSLATITTLTVLVLNNNQIPHEAGEALASVIMHNTRLEELYLHSNNLGIGTVKIAKSLQHITTLKMLSLGSNSIPQEASEELALAIKSNKQLEKLSLNDNNLHSSAIVILNSLATITTLTVLVLNNNQIPHEAGEALASVIMHNTRLEELDLHSNNVGIGTVKIAKSLQHITTLKMLSLGSNNIPQEASQELALAIESNQLLKKLWISNNSLHFSAIFILNCLATITTLTVLDLNNNQISHETGEALTSVIMHNTRLEELYLHSNNLGIGIVKVAKSLQHITTVKILNLSSNNIPQEASEELALAIESNQLLKKLWISNNNLHSSAIVFLNSLATITTLTVLDLSNNQIPHEAGEALASVIMHNTRLEELYLHSNNLGIGTVKIAKSLQHITTLKILSLGSNSIPQEASEELALAIKSNKQLEKLSLNDNNLHSSAIFILNCLATITTLTVLVLNNNQIPHEAGEALASVIMHNTRLEELYLDSNNLGIGTVKVARSLQHITTVKVLNLDNNNIPQEASEELALAIKSNKQLEKLSLNDNNLHSSAIVILNSLATITTLTVLNLSNNQIPHEAGEALASVIMHNTRLEELYLDSNNLGIGTVKVAKYLQHITTVKVLYLDNNNIPQEASKELALAIKSNKQLEKLSLNDNNLHFSAIFILNCLATITTLTVLVLNNNQIPHEAGEALAYVIMHNTRLEELYLDSNNLGIGTLKVARSLQHITTVKVLSLDNNNIPQEASEELALAIKSNKQLEKLSLNDNNLHSSAIVILNSLATITTLTVLVLNNNQIPHEAGEALASVIMHNTRLEELDLCSNNLGIGTVKVAKYLQHITTVKVLYLDNNNIPQEASKELALAIKSNKQLEKLSLNDNNLHFSAIFILNCLATITTLTVLVLNNNQIPHEAGEALASVIMHNTRLEELYLDSNNLGIGTLKVARSLQHITTVKVLFLDNNNIPQEASEELALAIKSNKQLEKLSLNDNNLHSSAIVILNSLATITTLTVLNLSNNQIPHEAGEPLASVIMHNTRLEELDLCSNNLGIGTVKVAKYLQHITTVKVLYLDNNNIPQEASEELALAIKSNKQLEKLSLNDNNLHSSAIFILNCLATITTLTVLVLNNNQIPHEAGEALASVIMHNTRLEELYLDSNNLGIGTLKVARSLQHITTVKVLSLDNNNIPQEASEELALAIKSNKQLEMLSLNDNNLHSSAIVILNSLATITTLTVLVLNNNQIPHEAGEALASVIMHNIRLEELYLHSNNLGIGTVKIAKSLQHITTLKMLSLGSNSIPQEASEELALAIKSNKQLEKLSLNDNTLHSSAIFILNCLATITTLTVLDLNNNQISHETGEALASVIMHNTRLEELYLHSNNLGIGTVKIAKSLQHITTVKVLYLDNNNIPPEASEELALAIESNQLLKKLWISNNNLHSSAIVFLNSLATITTLTVLDLSNNQISHETGEALASVIMHNTRLEELYLRSNNLGIGIVKVAKSLQHITTVKILSLSSNNIPQEASEELALAIESNQLLKKLWISNNNLHSSAIVFLNSLATITTLTVLDLSNNQISHEAGEALASVIMHNTRLEELYLHSNNLGIGTVKIAKSLQHITTVKVLYLDNNNIPQEASEELALAIESNQLLKKLWISNNNLHSSAIVFLYSLATITTLTVLDLSNNQIPHEAGEALAFVIMHNTRLEELYLCSNYLSIGTVKVAKSLQHITTVKVLYLDNNNIPQEASKELALAIKSNKQLEKLSLNDNNLHSSAIVILNSLATITTLTVLVLNNNQIPHEAGEALASVIMHNTRLKELYLHSNNLGIGTVKIAKSLQHITTLKMLSLGSNSIPQEASEELALAIESNQLLKKLWISNNSLHFSAIFIINCLATITTLTVLDLNNNQISHETGEALASVIMHNTRLEELYLRSNNLGIGIVKVAKSLQHITTVKILSLSSNNIPQEASEELALAIESNQLLKKLWISNNNLHFSAIVLLNSLATITTLTVLDLSNNQIPHEAGEALASVIMHNTRLEELYLDSNNLGIGTLKVARSLQHITTVKVLSLDNNNIPQEASEELALAIKSNKQLEKLSLNDNNLHSSAIVILNSLATITTLTVLNLSNNQIPHEAGEALASVIMHNTRLEELYLCSNNLGIGTVKVAKSLQHITTLRVLSLYYVNNIPRKACNEVALAIKSNTYLKGLCLNSNCLYSSLVLVLQALQSISNLNTLYIYGNTITEVAGNMLASVISRNVKLRMLTLNLLIAPLEVIDAIQNLSTLQALVFCTCKMSEQIEIKIASVITKNKSLTWLSLPNIILSQHVTLQAIATLSNLTTLWLEDNLLLEHMSNDLSLAISSNKSLERLILLDNMLQTGLIEVVKACNKLSNIKVLQLAHNCFIPSKVVELTSIITQNISLERVLLGGITLNAAECFHININEVLHRTDMTSYYNNTCCVTSSNHCALLEVIYLEMLRKQIDNTRKCYDVPICLNSKNFWFAHKIYHYFEHPSITQLKIQEVKCKLAQVYAKKIIYSMCILEKVKVIDLENNNIDEDASFELATALHSNNVLEQLWLRGNKLNTAGALYILDSLEYLTTLQVLDLSYNNIGSESADAIATVIDNNPLMNQLWLDGNNLYSTGTMVICNALKKIRTLSMLSLCNNGITDDAADELSAVITHNILLEDLLLSNNQLQYIGIAVIAESLSKLIKLRKLDLFNNNINRQGASSLAIVLQNSTSLQDLFLSGNNLETSGTLEICNALSHINSLHVLTLSNNNISDEVTSQLIEVLNNNHLYALLIGGNNLECGALKIARVIENDNIAMQLLDFSNNNISEQDQEKIKVVFSRRKNFQFYV